MISLLMALACPDLSGEYMTSAGKLVISQDGCRSISMSVGETRVEWDLRERGWQGDCAVQCAKISTDEEAIHARFRNDGVLGSRKCIYRGQSFSLNGAGDLVLSYFVHCLDGQMGEVESVLLRVN